MDGSSSGWLAPGNGALQRELKFLTEMGLVLRRTQGNQVLYQADSQSPFFFEVVELSGHRP
jgi:hypothetical protein